MIGLADANSFYASCEQVFDRKLKNKPVVVLSNNDGCIIARSHQAKSLVEMGVPLFQVQDIIKKNEITVFSSNYPLYGDMSKRVMNTLKRFVLDLEVYSIDEAFLDFRGYEANLDSYVPWLRATVLKWTGIPTTIGVSHTKVLSKVANKLAKKHGHGTFVLKDDADIKEALTETAVGDIWGIGRQYARFLNKNGITNAWEFRNAKDNWVKKYLTIVGLRLVKELRGEPCIPLEQITEPKKNIMVSRTFSHAVDSFDAVKEKVASFASRVAEKLRSQKSCANLISVFVRTDSFKEDQPQYNNSQMLRFKVATNYTPEIIAYALIALKKIYKEDYKYRKAGVMITGIVPDDQIQLNLFTEANALEREKKAKLMETMDKINAKIGRNTLKVATVPEDGFKCKQNMLSQRFTTSWDEILRV